MHTSKKFLSSAILICFSFFVKAQDGTIKIQRNSGRIDTNVIWCGGIWGRSWMEFELDSYQPIDDPGEVFYLPKNFSPKKFMMEDGYGAHIILSNHYTRVPYGYRGYAELDLITGFDHFRGKENDSLFTNVNAGHYNYSFNMIPVHLRLNINLPNRLNSRAFFLQLTAEGGKDLLFTKFTSTANNFNGMKTVNAFKGGLSFHFMYLKRHTASIALKAAYINKQWFRETDLSFPIFYGQYHK